MSWTVEVHETPEPEGLHVHITSAEAGAPHLRAVWVGEGQPPQRREDKEGVRGWVLR